MGPDRPGLYSSSLSYRRAGWWGELSTEAVCARLLDDSFSSLDAGVAVLMGRTVEAERQQSPDYLSTHPC